METGCTNSGGRTGGRSLTRNSALGTLRGQRSVLDQCLCGRNRDLRLGNSHIKGAATEESTMTDLENARTTRDAAQARVARLRGWLATTTATLDAIAADVKAGKTERLGEVSELSKDKSDIENELTSALADFESAEVAFHRE